MKTESTSRQARLATALSLATLLLGGVAGCHGDREEKPPRLFFPDMHDQPKWGPQEHSDFFPDGRTMRKPVAGTVPFGRNDFVRDPAQDTWAANVMEQRDDLLKDNKAFYFGLTDDGKNFIEKIPEPVTMDTLKLGQKKFNIYCSVCHGLTGDGQGTVGAYFTVKPANFHEKKFIVPDPTVPDPITRDGYVFNTARNGVRSMPGYAHALSERDTWAIVAYIRALQASGEGTLQDVPESQRPAIEAEFSKAPPPAPTPSTPPPAPAAPAGTPPAGGAK